MPRHPDVVPHQHDDGDAEHAGIEQLLARALECVGDDAGKHRDDAGAEDAAADTDRYPTAATGDAARCRHHDADDEAGFNHFAKDNDECAEHDLFRDDHALGGGLMIFANEGIPAGLQRPDANNTLRFSCHDLFHL